jgi:hypothetical protein
MKLRHLDRLTERTRTAATLGMPDILGERPTACLSGHYENDVAALPHVAFPDGLPAGLELALPPKMGKKRLFITSASQDRHHAKHVTSWRTRAASWGPLLAIKSLSWARNCRRRQPVDEVPISSAPVNPMAVREGNRHGDLVDAVTSRSALQSSAAPKRCRRRLACVVEAGDELRPSTPHRPTATCERTVSATAILSS